MSKFTTVIEVNGDRATFDGVRWVSNNEDLVAAGEAAIAARTHQPRIPEYRYLIARDVADLFGGKIVSHVEDEYDPDMLY